MNAFKPILSTLIVMSIMTPLYAADLVKAKAKPKEAPDRCAKSEPAKGTPEVPGGDIFGFTDATDIGDPCSWGFSSENDIRAGRRDGRYFALNRKSEIGYTVSDRVAVSFGFFDAYTRWRDVNALQDTLAGEGDGVVLDRLSRFGFDGLSFEALYRVLARSPGQPWAVTIGAEPRWSRLDGATGYRAEGVGVELKIFADVALADQWFAAMNFVYELGATKFDIPNATRTESSATTFSAALTKQIYAAEKRPIEAVYLGVEGRVLSSYEGLGLDHNVGDAFFLGPTLALALAGDRMLNIV